MGDRRVKMSMRNQMQVQGMYVPGSHNRGIKLIFQILHYGKVTDVSHYKVFLKQTFSLMNNYVPHKMSSTMIYLVARSRAFMQWD